MDAKSAKKCDQLGLFLQPEHGAVRMTPVVMLKPLSSTVFLLNEVGASGKATNEGGDKVQAVGEIER